MVSCRNFRFSALLLVSLGATLGCHLNAQRATQSPRAPAKGYARVFDDEFRTLDLSPDGSGAHAWYEKIWFHDHHAPLSNIHVDSSILHLDWTREMSSRDTSITTLSPDTQTVRAWRYGYFEARMRWAPVRGAWPAFWLIPVEDAEGSDVYDGVKESGEIDVFEGQGNHPDTFYGTIHDWVNTRDSASRNNCFVLPDSVRFSDFHVYGLMWTPGKVTWYFDNVPLHSEATPPVFDRQDFFMVLGMQEGVDWKYGNLSDVSVRKLTLDVDWVRVWQKR
jgi:hypothetical protein